MTGKRIIWIAIGVLFAIVAMAAVAVPYWSGTQIEARLRALIAAGQPAGYATDIQSFDRGILQSKAMTRTRYRGPSGASLDLIFEHRIDHGPKLGQRALARIESTLRLAEGELANLRPALAGAAPLTIVTLIHADGSQDVDAWAPPFEVRDIDGQGGQLAFAGFSGRLE
ncbi:MAG: DUF945 family protein, partial [Gammaproteobacteria bacterium]